MGAIASVDAAESFAQNNPSGAEKEAMKAVSGAALVVVRLRLQKASFQERMIHKRAADAIPGKASGRRIYLISSKNRTPSTRPASRIS